MQFTAEEPCAFWNQICSIYNYCITNYWPKKTWRQKIWLCIVYETSFRLENKEVNKEEKHKEVNKEEKHEGRQGLFRFFPPQRIIPPPPPPPPPVEAVAAATSVHVFNHWIRLSRVSRQCTQFTSTFQEADCLLKLVKINKQVFATTLLSRNLNHIAQLSISARGGGDNNFVSRAGGGGGGGERNGKDHTPLIISHIHYGWGGGGS